MPEVIQDTCYMHSYIDHWHYKYKYLEALVTPVARDTARLKGGKPRGLKMSLKCLWDQTVFHILGLLRRGVR